MSTPNPPPVSAELELEPCTFKPTVDDPIGNKHYFNPNLTLASPQFISNLSLIRP